VIEAKKKDSAHAVHYRTVDGMSTFAEESNLGHLLSQVEEGHGFGEAAIHNDGVHQNSAMCLTDCELIGLDAAMYRKAMQRETEKLQTFNMCVPGLLQCMQTMPPDAHHPARVFKEANFPAGHMLFFEGIAAEATIFLIVEGSIQLRRCKRAQDHFAFSMAHMPLSEAWSGPVYLRPSKWMSCQQVRFYVQWRSSVSRILSPTQRW